MDVFSLQGIIMAFQGCYTVLASFFGYGLGLVAFAFVISTVLLPIVKWAVKISKKETKLQSVIAPQIAEYKNKYKGAELSNAIARIYKRYSYNPLFSIRQSMQAVIQIPVLILAYFALSDYVALEGKSFLFFKDLSKPDGLLFGISLMPFVMTLINCITVKLGNFTKKEQKASCLIALLFLVLLYTAPAALLIYWTTNNFYNLLLTLKKKHHQSFFKFDLKSWINNKENEGPLVVALSILVPTTFVWSNNVNFLDVNPILFCSAIAIVISALVFVGLTLLINFTKKYVGVKLIDLGLVFVASFIIFSLGRSAREFLHDYKYYVLLAIFVVFYSFYLIARFKLLKTCFILLLSINSFVFLYNVQDEKNSGFKEKIDSGFAYNFILKNKPNIYYFLLESIQSEHVLKDIYDFDATCYSDTLRKLGYTVYDDIYSNRSFTLGTLSALMKMNLNYESKGNFDGGLYVRETISGGPENNLMRLLKLNGYKTSLFMSGDSYFGFKKGQYLDYYDNVDDYASNYSPYLEPFFAIHHKIENFVRQFYLNEKLEIPSSEQLVENFTKINDNKVPQAFFHRIAYSGHTDPSGSYSYKNKKEWVASNSYQNGIKREFEAVIEIADEISKNDPNAVVIFLGDHGSWRLRGYPLESSQNEIEKFAKSDSESIDSFVDDMFSVYAAIKMPKGVEPPNDFSSVNVFLEVFAKLNPNMIDRIQCTEKPNVLCLSTKLNIIKTKDGLKFIETNE